MLQKLKRDDKGESAIAKIIGLVVICLLGLGVVGSVAFQAQTASTNGGVATIPGGASMVLLVGLLFIVGLVYLAWRHVEGAGGN